MNSKGLKVIEGRFGCEADRKAFEKILKRKLRTGKPVRVIRALCIIEREDRTRTLCTMRQSRYSDYLGLLEMARADLFYELGKEWDNEKQ